MRRQAVAQPHHTSKHKNQADTSRHEDDLKRHLTVIVIHDWYTKRPAWKDG